MNCLHCGHCCKTLNPFNDSVCPHLVEIQGIFLCSIYEKRPQVCKDHEYPYKHCPIGIDILKIVDAQGISKRIDEGYQLLTPTPPRKE
jgi:hypothetical protein